MDGTSTESIAIDALVRLSLAEGNGFDPSTKPGCTEMTLPMSDGVRHAGAEDPALSYIQTLGEPIPSEGFVDEAADVLVTFPFPPDAIAAARAEAARSTSWRTAWRTGFAMIGVAVVCKEGLRDPPNGIGVGIGLLFLVAALLLFGRRPRAGKVARPD